MITKMCAILSRRRQSLLFKRFRSAASSVAPDDRVDVGIAPDDGVAPDDGIAPDDRISPQGPFHR